MAQIYSFAAVTTTPETENVLFWLPHQRRLGDAAGPMPALENTYALILAGGSGTRFWPLSRNRKPKQLLDLFGSGTLLEQTIRRLQGLVPTENILILTNELQLDAVREIAYMLPPENLFAEPAKRDTGPAVALGIGLVAARNPQAVMMVLPSDQLIQDTAAYHSVMQDALATAAQSDGLVTIGIPPTWPCPSFGYIERGAAAEIPGLECQHPPVEVTRFREKPDPAQAAEFLAQGNFAWNGGMFVWSLPTVIDQLAKHAPELASFVHTLRDSTDIRATVEEKFPQLTPLSIDYALMEHADRVLSIQANFDWDDVGSWPSIAKYLALHGQENRANQPISEIDSRNNIVFNARPETRVALLGVHDLIIVQTDDALLIADRHQADAIKKLVDILPEDLH